MTRVYTVISTKGGAGETTSTANLGTTLAMTDHNVAVIGGDLGMPNFAGALDVGPDGTTLHDVLTGEATAETIVYDGLTGPSVLPGLNAFEAFTMASVKEFEPVISTLETSYDIVITDTGVGLSGDTSVPLRLADEVILISMTEREALGDTGKTRQLTDRISAGVAGVVLMCVDQSKPNANVVVSLLDIGVITVVPESPVIREVFGTWDPVIVHSPGSIVTAGYHVLAEVLIETPVPVPGLDDETDEVDMIPEPMNTADPKPNPEPVSSSDFVEDSGGGVNDGAGPATTPDLDSSSGSMANPDAAAATDEGRAMADPEPESEAEPNVEAEPEGGLTIGIEPEAELNTGAEPEPAVDSDTDDDLAALTPFSASTAEELDDPAKPSPTSGADVPESAADPAVDSVVNLGDDTPADSPVVDTSDDPVLADLDPVDSEETDTGPLAVDLSAVTRGTPTTDEETAAVADDEAVSDVDAGTGSMDVDPLAEGTAADGSRSAPSASAEGTDTSGVDEPLAAEAEPDAAEAKSDATETNPDAGDSPEDDEEGVYTVSPVEEVESFGDDECDEKKKGFLSRFPG